MLTDYRSTFSSPAPLLFSAVSSCPQDCTIHCNNAVEHCLWLWISLLQGLMFKKTNFSFYCVSCCTCTSVSLQFTVSAESFLCRMWLNGTLAVSTQSWTLWRARAGSRSKESTHHTSILACGRVPSRGTRRTWICTASTTCTLGSPSPGMSVTHLHTAGQTRHTSFLILSYLVLLVDFSSNCFNNLNAKYSKIINNPEHIPLKKQTNKQTKNRFDIFIYIWHLLIWTDHCYCMKKTPNDISPVINWLVDYFLHQLMPPYKFIKTGHKSITFNRREY